jgi:Excreted virulence factor EspC, type VII ESX diderm
MAEMIRVNPANLRDAATRHAEAADYLRAVPDTHDAIEESLDSLGPIFGEFREAGRQLLEQRRLCYRKQADDHAEIADQLRSSAAYWDEHEAERAAAFRSVVDDPS